MICMQISSVCNRICECLPCDKQYMWLVLCCFHRDINFAVPGSCHHHERFERGSCDSVKEREQKGVYKRCNGAGKVPPEKPQPLSSAPGRLLVKLHHPWKRNLVQKEASGKTVVFVSQDICKHSSTLVKHSQCFHSLFPPRVPEYFADCFQ